MTYIKICTTGNGESMEQIELLKQEIESLKKELNTIKTKTPSKNLSNITQELSVFAKKQSVLFITDSEKITKSLDEIKSIFNKFEVVDSSYECIECLNSSYDITVVDIDIDKNAINGVELIDKIKSSYPTKILVAVSKNLNYDLVIKMLDLKVDGFLLYPYSNDELFEMFAKFSEKVIYKDIFTDFKIEETIKQRLAEEKKQLERTLISSGEKYKTSAKEYISLFQEEEYYQELVDSIADIVEESRDLELILLDIMESSIYSEDVRNRAIEFFTHAEKIFFDMKEFDEVGLAFGELIIIFERLTLETIKEISDEVFKHIYLLNKNFIHLLSDIFIKPSSPDIHALDEEFVKNIYSIKEELGFIDESTYEDEELAGFLL
jgi:DNA-binding NarL/FixJ family response regulator